MPGGEGFTHDTGKNDDGYCIQYPNKTSIRDAMNQEKCHTGFGEEVTEVSEYKWMLNWIEIYEKLEGPFEATLRYILKEEAPLERPEVEFVKPKYYLPADAWPAFELNMYKGTPRRIAYKFNNTKENGTEPAEACYIDWPENNLMKPCVWK